MRTTTVKSYWANVYVGLREGYGDVVRTPDEVYWLCRGYCDDVGLCVSLTETTFVYKDGGDPGLIIGLINYPRFPSETETVRKHAMKLAEMLMTFLKQNRVSVVFPDFTIMLENET